MTDLSCFAFFVCIDFFIHFLQFSFDCDVLQTTFFVNLLIELIFHFFVELFRTVASSFIAVDDLTILLIIRF